MTLVVFLIALVPTTMAYMWIVSESSYTRKPRSKPHKRTPYGEMLLEIRRHSLQLKRPSEQPPTVEQDIENMRAKLFPIVK